jgi:hypothetical protein
MTEPKDLKSCIGRLLFDDSFTFASMFSSSLKVSELLIEFDTVNGIDSIGGGPICYSMQPNYKRKYIINEKLDNKTGVHEWHIINTCQIKYSQPKYNYTTRQYVSVFKTKMPVNIGGTGTKLTASIYNCEFSNLKGICCLKICLTTNKHMFCIWYNPDILSPEDVTDICGQIITYSDIA